MLDWRLVGPTGKMIHNLQNIKEGKGGYIGGLVLDCRIAEKRRTCLTIF